MPPPTSPSPFLPPCLLALEEEALDMNRMLTQLLWGLASQVQSHVCVCGAGLGLGLGG